MNSFDSTIGSSFAGGSSGAGAPIRRTSRAADSSAPARAEAPVDPTSGILQQLADRAMEFPPKDFHVLAASVQKFLLTNLEPALRMARQIREDMDNSPRESVQVIAPGRRDEAMAVLTG